MSLNLHELFVNKISTHKDQLVVLYSINRIE